MKRQNLFVNYDRNPFREVDDSAKQKNRWQYIERNNDYDSKHLNKVDLQIHDRLQNQKNHVNIIDAIHELTKRGPTPNAGKIRKQVNNF